MLPGPGAVPLDLIPVDIVSNSLLITTAHGARAQKNIHIYNCSTSATNPITVYNYKNCLRKAYNQIALNGRTTDRIEVDFVTSEFKYQLKKKVNQELPIKLIEYLAKIPFVNGKQLTQRAKDLNKARLKLNDVVELFRFFIMNEWNYENKKIEKIAQLMSPEEREEFNYDVQQIEWQEYTTLYCKGMAIWVMK